MKFDELYKKVIDSCRAFEERRVPISLDFKIEDLRDALVESNDTIEQRLMEIAEKDAEIARLNDKLRHYPMMAALIEIGNKEIAELKADYKEACDRLQTTNLIKDEQKAKADKLLSCLKCLVMRDLIKDCPEKNSAIEIVKEYDLW